MKKLINRKGNSKSFIVVMMLAIIVAIGTFVYLKTNDVKVYLANDVIPAGTKITSDMLVDGTILVREVSASLTNKYVISDFKEIEDFYVKETLRPGKIIYSYDMAKEENLRSNEILTAYDLEAVTIDIGHQEGISHAANRGDKVNVYGTYVYDLSPLFEISLMEDEDGEIQEIAGIPVSFLPIEFQEVFYENGYDEDYLINSKDITITKLLLQNVPIVDVRKNDQGKIEDVTLGLEPEHAEAIYLTLRTGRIGLSVLPYIDGNYVEKETKGSISFGELRNKGIINDVELRELE
jgi:hypothetical protein